MKLSDLIEYRNLLDKFDLAQPQVDASLSLGQIKYLVNTNPAQINNFAEDIEQQYQNIINGFDIFADTIGQLRHEISKIIEEAEKPYFVQSYKLYENMTKNDTAEYLLNRRSTSSAESENFLRARLQYHATWQYPAMVIRPGLEPFVKDLVSYDPLYLVDQSYDLLKPCVESFAEEYRRRIRTYAIIESLDLPILDKLPDGQFGMCFAYNFFNFKPLEIIRKYLEEIYVKLRPGGMLILTFNDGDRSAGVKLCERNFSCYVPGKLLESLSESIGYTRVFSWNDNGASTWLELKKPGLLTTIRGGQTLAEVKSRPTPLTAEELEKQVRHSHLTNLAVGLGWVPEPQIKYSTEELELIVETQQQLENTRQIELAQQQELEKKQAIEEQKRLEKEQSQLVAKQNAKLRQQALDLNLGDPNLIKYGYTIEKIKSLIQTAIKK